VRELAVAWNVQGTGATRTLLGFDLPEKPNTLAAHGSALALWLGPRSWLVLLEHAPCAFAQARDALNAAGGALFDVSASRVAFTASAEALAKGCPLDFGAFPPRACAQSVFAGVNVLLYRLGDAPELTLLVARSFARDLARLL